ncbi:MAG TPA: hypothetical protein DCQ32_05095 [Cyanobacteria bacterium UBA8156]|jgi:hypothetical protein|nr:hypothetical protein [Cyanobacteria bacterium UBA8156]
MGWQQDWRDGKRWLNVGLGLMAAALAVGLQMPRLQRATGGESAVDSRNWVAQEEIRLQALKLLPERGFGFRNMVANWTFLSFLQYFGDDVARDTHGTGYTLSGDYFDIIVRSDPRFVYSYLYLSTAISMYSADPRRAIALYRQGLPFLDPKLQPNAFLVWRFRGIDELLFLGDGSAARQSFAQAAEWAEIAAERAANPEDLRLGAQVSRQTAAFLAENPASLPARRGAWKSVLALARDRKTVERAVLELRALGTEATFVPGEGWRFRRLGGT